MGFASVSFILLESSDSGYDSYRQGHTASATLDTRGFCMQCRIPRWIIFWQCPYVR